MVVALSAWSILVNEVKALSNIDIRAGVPELNEAYFGSVSTTETGDAKITFNLQVNNNVINNYVKDLQKKHFVISTIMTFDDEIIGYHADNNRLNYRVSVMNIHQNQSFDLIITPRRYISWEEGITEVGVLTNRILSTLPKPNLEHIYLIRVDGAEEYRIGSVELYGDIETFKADYILLLEAAGYVLMYDTYSEGSGYALPDNPNYGVKIEHLNDGYQDYIFIEIDAKAQMVQASDWNIAIDQAETYLGIDLSALPEFATTSVQGNAVGHKPEMYNVAINILGATLEEVDAYNTALTSAGFSNKLTGNHLGNSAYDPLGKYYISVYFDEGDPNWSMPNKATILIYAFKAAKNQTNFINSLIESEARLDIDLTALKNLGLSTSHYSFYTAKSSHSRTPHMLIHARGASGSGVAAEIEAWKEELLNNGFKHEYTNSLRKVYFHPRLDYALYITGVTNLTIRIYTGYSENMIPLDGDVYNSPITAVNYAIWLEKLEVKDKKLLPFFESENFIPIYAFEINEENYINSLMIGVGNVTREDITAYFALLKTLDFAETSEGKMQKFGVSIWEENFIEEDNDDLGVDMNLLFLRVEYAIS